MPVAVAPAVVVVVVVVMAAILLLVLCTCAVEFLPFRNARFEAKEDGLITFGVALARMCIALAKDCTRRMLGFLCTIAKAGETMPAAHRGMAAALCFHILAMVCSTSQRILALPDADADAALKEYGLVPT